MANIKPIGTSFDRNFRNDLNANFDALDKRSATTQQQIDDLVLDGGKSSAELVQARGGETLLYKRLDKTDQGVSEALGKASNPLNALSAAGYKIQLGDLSDEVKGQMAGTTPITDARGLLNNSSVDYPLKKVVRNGVFEGIDSELKNAILDAKVINAKKGKYYRIQWVGNGVTTLGPESSWGFIIAEHDKSTFSSTSETNVIRHVDRADNNFSQPTGITTRYLESKVDDTFFIITIDYSKLVSRTSYDLNNNAGSKVGYSSVIDDNSYIISTMSADSKPVICKVDGDNIKVKFKYSATIDLVLEFDLMGINQITHLRKVSRQTNSSKYPTPYFASAVSWYNVDTDWVSPYGIMAKENIVNPAGNFTVGGNHGTESGSGFATARKIETKVFADGLEIANGETAYGDQIVIKTQNYVSASNAIDLTTGVKRDSVKEYVTYKITKNSVEVTTALEAMEPVDITRYAGLQATKGVYTELYFMKDATPQAYNIASTPSAQISSGNKSNSAVDRAVLKDGDDLLVVYMDRAVGVGDLSYFSTGAPLAYYTTANKVYLHNISGRSVEMATGDEIYYRGGYTFAKSLPCPGAKSAYTIKFGSESKYVVDMFTSGQTVLTVGADDVGKLPTNVTSAGGVSVGSLITSKGLKVSSSGYGEVKFAAK